MIFVCVGSREYQFDRLLIELDNLVEQYEIQDDIFAQIGQSTYEPKNYNYKRFVNVDEFNLYQTKADIIISHGGTGALIGALKKRKQVLAVPRLEKYGEHIDDHQLQVAAVLEEEGYLKVVTDIKNLIEGINFLKNNPIKKIYSENTDVLNIINDFIIKTK